MHARTPIILYFIQKVHKGLVESSWSLESPLRVTISVTYAVAFEQERQVKFFDQFGPLQSDFWSLSHEH